MGAAGHDVLIRPAAAADLAPVLTLLAAAGLPEAGLPAHVETVLVAGEGGAVVGCAALEIYGGDALLRSVTVAKDCRGQGLGARLTKAALELAGARGIRRVFLLTTDADAYFATQGFTSVERDTAPTSIRASDEFASACPASAKLLLRRIDGSRIPGKKAG